MEKEEYMKNWVNITKIIKSGGKLTVEKSRFSHHVLDTFMCWAVVNHELAWEWTSSCGIFYSLISFRWESIHQLEVRGRRTILIIYACIQVGLSLTRILGHPPSPSLKTCWQDGHAEKGGWRPVLTQALLFHRTAVPGVCLFLSFVGGVRPPHTTFPILFEETRENLFLIIWDSVI